MSDLLTAKDVEIKAFKKVKFGGYSIPEVEDFLNQVAEDIEAYSMQLDEKDSRIQELENFVNKQEAMTDAIKDALIQARKAAKDIEDQAKVNTEKLIAEAQADADKRVAEAQEKAEVIISSAEAQAANILQTSQDRSEQAEQSRAGIEHELESYRLEARQKAEVIIDDAKRKSDEILEDAQRKAGVIIDGAKNEAQKMMTDAEREIENYEKQLQFLSLQKQQFVKNTVSLLFDFGKIMDQAQQEIDDEVASISVDGQMSDVSSDTDSVNSDTVNVSEIEEL